MRRERRTLRSLLPPLSFGFGWKRAPDRAAGSLKNTFSFPHGTLKLCYPRVVVANQMLKAGRQRYRGVGSSRPGESVTRTPQSLPNQEFGNPGSSVVGAAALGFGHLHGLVGTTNDDIFRSGTSVEHEIATNEAGMLLITQVLNKYLQPAARGPVRSAAMERVRRDIVTNEAGMLLKAKVLNKHLQRSAHGPVRSAVVEQLRRDIATNEAGMLLIIKVLKKYVKRRCAWPRKRALGASTRSCGAAAEQRCPRRLG